MEYENRFGISNDKLQTHSEISNGRDSTKNTRKEKEIDLQDLAKEFAALKVSVAGVSNIVESRSLIRRYFWCICVIVVTIFMGYMTTKVVLEYLSYPKMMIIEDTIQHKLPFPAVTVCSLNPISNFYVKYTSLQKFVGLKKLIDSTKAERRNYTQRDACLNKPLCRWAWFQEKCECIENPCLTEFCLAENSSQCRCLPGFCEKGAMRVEGCRKEYIQSTNKKACFCNGASNQKFYDSNWEEENNTGLFDLIEDEDVKEIIWLVRESETFDLFDIDEALQPTTKELYRFGDNYDSLIASCTFEGIHCYRENFTALYDPTYGRCYMFNYVGNSASGAEKPIEIDTYGSKSGLQLVLRVADHNVLDLVRREIGARIVIHDPHVLPFVAEHGLNLRPKDMTALELSYSTIQRLGKPWGNCSDETTLPNGDPYSLLGCEKYCSHETLMAYCNCTMRHLLHGMVLENLEANYTLCNISNYSERYCSSDVMEIIDSTGICDCRSPCRQTIYSYSAASSKLNEKFYNTVKAIRTLKLNSNRTELRHVNFTSMKSLVGVKVYFNSFEVSSQSEVPSYSWETLMANIGGNLGFFMGFTLITFVELAEFIWDSISAACRRIPGINKNLKRSTMKP
ncbi:Amiloride-sensitive sodium channel subunit like protein [Argiope bruennichi]|uniref:Amiloride-sensitive sodium channel subunit like protein n=1 Tax=Argiope bruennichi TaxID=94029 RepID=A0A8T0EWP1_ARGBR|nr:Amiloride-sensitive sodium channel subunit like protein [Argiope bruennichi]